MSRELRKFVLEAPAMEYELEVTEGAKCLAIRELGETLVMWFLLNPDAEKSIAVVNLVEDTFKLKDAIDELTYVDTIVGEDTGYHFFVSYKKPLPL